MAMAMINSMREVGRSIRPTIPTDILTEASIEINQSTRANRRLPSIFTGAHTKMSCKSSAGIHKDSDNRAIHHSDWARQEPIPEWSPTDSNQPIIDDSFNNYLYPLSPLFICSCSISIIIYPCLYLWSIVPCVSTSPDGYFVGMLWAVLDITLVCWVWQLCVRLCY